MKICVVGTGTMGNGIAQVFAQAGHDVLLKGRSEASLAKAHKAMDKNLSRMVEKGKLEAAAKDGDQQIENGERNGGNLKFQHGSFPPSGLSP